MRDPCVLFRPIEMNQPRASACLAPYFISYRSTFKFVFYIGITRIIEFSKLLKSENPKY
jgi:hypothetical protein